MSSNRVVWLLLAALVLICQSAYSQAGLTGKFRVELDSGERFVLSKGTLTSDSLIGKTFSGKEEAVPVRSVYTLERATGSYAQEGAAVGTLVGVTLFFVSSMYSKAKSDRSGKELDTDKIPLKLFGFISAGGVLGLVVGSETNKWQAIRWKSVIGGEADNAGLRLQLSLRF